MSTHYNAGQQLLSALWDAPPERYTLRQELPAPKYDDPHKAAVAEALACDHLAGRLTVAAPWIGTDSLSKAWGWRQTWAASRP